MYSPEKQRKDATDEKPLKQQVYLVAYLDNLLAIAVVHALNHFNIWFWWEL